MSGQIKVIVGLSGGVDSSVAALLLKQQGYEVVGLYMKNWEEKDSSGVCSSQKDFEDVVRVADFLDIPYYTVNFAKEYWQNVFTECLYGYKKGYTPNPDVLCNREIKFKVFLQKAKEFGADFMATGHYCQIKRDTTGCYLLKGKDPDKDQSYFLYMVKSEALKHVLFPLGHLTKSEVREIAREHQLPTAEKKDSTGICFIGKRKFKFFLGKYIDFTPGNFENSKGQVIGQHDGIPFYTIGQRKGLNIGGRGEAWFVIGKDVKRNVVIVEQGEQNPHLFANTVEIEDPTWISEKAIPIAKSICQGKIRYRQKAAQCTVVELKNDKATLSFLKPQRAVTPGQSVVLYDGDLCLGGGIISS